MRPILYKKINTKTSGVALTRDALMIGGHHLCSEVHNRVMPISRQPQSLFKLCLTDLRIYIIRHNSKTLTILAKCVSRATPLPPRVGWFRF